MTCSRRRAPALAIVFVAGIAGIAAALGAMGDAAVQTGGSARAFAQRPVPGLSQEQRARFARGASELDQLWTVAPSAFGRWGRGPTSNAERCSDCHAQGGRGRPPQGADEPLGSLLVRLSVMHDGAAAEHPVYGDQLQPQGVLGKVPGEGEVRIDWIAHSAVLTDGTVVPLRAPRLRFHQLAFGPIAADTLISLRQAPPLWGLGLLEAVPEPALREAAADQQAHGVDGRLNQAWDLESHRARTGRFGLKASQPSLRQQIAHALHADLGVTSALFPEENCPPPQRACRAMPAPPLPEIQPEQLNALEFYIRAMAPPAATHADPALVARGEVLFRQADCSVCHLPTLITGDSPAVPQLARQAIHPYTDLLLHDMGEGLADGRPDLKAGPRDWRTAPLWGLGTNARVNGNAFLLHDGRARDVSEAILWHGGEAEAARAAFARMSRAEREALVAFVLSL